jgi:ribosomal protein L29
MKIKLLSVKELRTKKEGELNNYIAELQVNRSNLIDAIQTGKEKTTHQLGQIKRSIAKAKTVLSEAAKSASTKENK